jgi:hypothetical protein
MARPWASLLVRSGWTVTAYLPTSFQTAKATTPSWCSSYFPPSSPFWYSSRALELRFEPPYPIFGRLSHRAFCNVSTCVAADECMHCTVLTCLVADKLTRPAPPSSLLGPSGSSTINCAFAPCRPASQRVKLGPFPTTPPTSLSAPWPQGGIVHQLHAGGIPGRSAHFLLSAACFALLAMQAVLAAAAPAAGNAARYPPPPPPLLLPQPRSWQPIDGKFQLSRRRLKFVHTFKV